MTEGEVLINVDHVSKKFSKDLRKALWYGTTDLIRGIVGKIPNRDRLRKSEYWALDDIHFQLKRGDILGIAGHNGSGKSTLLRIISGIYVPEKGRVVTKGSLLPLFSVGQGFHSYMSGRENIRLKGAMLGMTKKEIEEKMEEIISFAGLEEFGDAAYSTYSSGMRARLGFSLSVHTKQDILLLDEVFAKGDLEFRLKSFHKLKEISHNAAIILVSHKVDRLELFCNRLLVLNRGKMVYYDEDVAAGLKQYESLLGLKKGDIPYHAL